MEPNGQQDSETCMKDFFSQLHARVRCLLKCVKPGNYVTTEDDGEDEDQREESVKKNNEEAFVKSLYYSGGVTSLLYLFGRVIEVSHDPRLHSDALRIVLSSVHFISEVRESFLAMDGYSMVNQAILANKCLLSRSLFETYLHHCVIYTSSPAEDDGSTISTTGATSSFSEACHAESLGKKPKNELKHGLIRNSLAFLHLFRLWKKWHKDHDVASYLYSVLLSLISCEENPFYHENLMQFRSVNFLQEITFMLHSSLFEHQNESVSSKNDGEDNVVQPSTYQHTYSSQFSCLNKRDVSSLCKIVRILVGVPTPILSEVTTLVKCLTYLHDSNKAYVCQSKQMMCFLLPQQVVNNAVSKEQPSQSQPDHPKHQVNVSKTNNGSVKNRLRHYNDSVSSIDDWLMIKTTNDIITETVHSIIFSSLVDALTQIICDVQLGSLPEILGPVLSADHFVIWSNNENVLIRESVLRCLMMTLKKQQMQYRQCNSAGQQSSPLSGSTSNTTSSANNSKGFTHDFLDKNSFFLLSNQMTQYKVSPELVSIVISFILDTMTVAPKSTQHNRMNGPSSVTETNSTTNNGQGVESEGKVNQMLCLDEDWSPLTRNWLKVTPIEAAAFTLLFSLAVKSTDNVHLCHWILMNFSKLLKSIPSSSHILKYLFDNGIMQCLINILDSYHDNRDKLFSTTRVNGTVVGSLASGNNNVLQTTVFPSGLDLEDDIIEKDVYAILEILSSKLINSTGNVFQEAFDRTLDLFLMLYLSYPTSSPQARQNILTPTQSLTFNFPSTQNPHSSITWTNKKTSFREAVIHVLRSAFDDIERHSSMESARLLLSQSSFRGE